MVQDPSLDRVLRFFNFELPSALRRNESRLISTEGTLCLIVEKAMIATLHFGLMADLALTYEPELDVDLVAAWEVPGFVALLDGDMNLGKPVSWIGDPRMLQRFGSLLIDPVLSSKRGLA